MGTALFERYCTVEYEIFATLDGDFGRSFFRDFQNYSIALGNRASFTPHTYIFEGYTLGCANLDGWPCENENLCPSICTNGGRYCMLPEATQDQSNTATEVPVINYMREALRRICVWDVYGASNPILFWNYVNDFNKHCISEGLENELCALESFHRIGIDTNKVDDCFQQHSSLEDDCNANMVLINALENQRLAGVAQSPTIVVNGMHLPERKSSADDVLHVICCSLKHPRPPICGF